MYKIYGRSGCSACDSAKSILKQKGFDFQYLMFGKDYTMADFLALTTQKTFPLIIKNGKVIGSFSDLLVEISE